VTFFDSLCPGFGVLSCCGKRSQLGGSCSLHHCSTLFSSSHPPRCGNLSPPSDAEALEKEKRVLEPTVFPCPSGFARFSATWIIPKFHRPFRMFRPPPRQRPLLFANEAPPPFIFPQALHPRLSPLSPRSHVRSISALIYRLFVWQPPPASVVQEFNWLYTVAFALVVYDFPHDHS